MEDDIVVEEVSELQLASIIGFDVNGLRLHPDDIHIVYPLGSKVVIQNWETKHQSFLSGHTNIISSIDISPNGKYVASGQINHMGFKSSVIVWDFEKRELHAKYEIHKVRVECVAFSCDSVYLVSLGGRDDSNIIVWDVEARDAMCGNLSNTGTSGDAAVLYTTNQRGLCFVSGGINNLRVWTINPQLRNLQVVEVALGMIRRHIHCMVIDERDDFLFCGTTTGDIMKVKLNYSHDVRAHKPIKNPVLLGCYGKYGGKKKLLSGEPCERFRNGVTALLLLPKDLEDRMVVGAGDGTVEMVREKEVCLPKGSPIRIPSLPQLRVLKSTNVDSGVTSLILNGELLFAGTQLCEIHTVHVETFDVVRHTTCHTNAIFGIAFVQLSSTRPGIEPGTHFSDLLCWSNGPRRTITGRSGSNYSEVFATGSKEDIRIWKTTSSQELLRICVDNFTCSSLQFKHDGTAIVSGWNDVIVIAAMLFTGWNDGVIRSFTPQTGRLIFAIHNAHYRGVSAIAINSRGDTIVSGGGEGQVRVWDISPNIQSLKGVLKEHKSPVSSIHMCRTDTSVVSASMDGTCIIWDIVRLVRQQILFANTQFMCARYCPTGVQVVTAGTDRRIGYWEVYDGSLVRELEGSTASGLNALDVNSKGDLIVTGGNDQVIKLWKYMEGVATHVGLGHAGIITAVTFSPDNRYIVSVSADGGIFRWVNPYWDLPHEAEEGEEDEVRSLPSSAGTRSTCSLREEDLALHAEDQPPASPGPRPVPSPDVGVVCECSQRRKNLGRACKCLEGGKKESQGDSKSTSARSNQSKISANLRSGAGKKCVCPPRGDRTPLCSCGAVVNSRNTGNCVRGRKPGTSAGENIMNIDQKIKTNNGKSSSPGSKSGSKTVSARSNKCPWMTK
uniref:Cilia- and flagella-associated protein 52 n=1 Tax=Timema bartmani TaxID=61472 RepID=A0A7R9F508_9NEOP|nr:unnamed protein product [Timema bartmani]